MIETEELINLNDIAIVDGVVFNKDKVHRTDFSKIDITKPYENVLFLTGSKIEDDLQTLLSCYCYANLSGAKLQIYSGFGDKVNERVLGLLDMHGIEYNVVDPTDLPYPYEWALNDQGWDRTVGYWAKKNGVRTHSANSLCVVHHFKKSLVIQVSTNTGAKTTKTISKLGATTLVVQPCPITVDNLIDDFNGCVTKVIDKMTPNAYVCVHDFDNAPSYDDVPNSFDNPVLNLAVAKSIKEMNFEQIILAYRFAEGNDKLLLLKKMGYKW